MVSTLRAGQPALFYGEIYATQTREQESIRAEIPPRHDAYEIPEHGWPVHAGRLAALMCRAITHKLRGVIPPRALWSSSAPDGYPTLRYLVANVSAVAWSVPGNGLSVVSTRRGFIPTRLF